MRGIIESVFNSSWGEFISSQSSDHKIQSLIKGVGWFYLLCGLAAAFIRYLKGVSGVLLQLGAVSLAFLALLYCKERFLSPAQFFEYSLQWSSPLFLIAFHKENVSTKKLILWMKIAIAVTFSSHGFYAIGFYSLPGTFVQMVMNTTGVGEGTAIVLLKVAGILDFIVSGLLFYPAKLLKPALAYLALWGLLTSLARIWAFFHIEFWSDSLKQWLHESIYRLPHFFIPLFVLLALSSLLKHETEPNNLSASV